MANDLTAGERWARTVVEEMRRFKSLRPRRGRVLRYTPMPPEVRADMTRSLGIWPLSQSTRDGMVDMLAKNMAGVQGSFALRHGAIPEPETSRAAAAVEAEANAAASAYAAAKDLATHEVRFEVFQTYGKELWSRAYLYAKSRRPSSAAAGTSSSSSRAAGPAALPAASVRPRAATGGVRSRGRSRASPIILDD